MILDPAVVAAGVAAIASIIAATMTYFFGIRQQRVSAHTNHELHRRSINDDREFAAQAEMDRLWEPLHMAAWDLHHRIWNIRSNNFSTYLRSQDHRRRRVAVLSTSYRFARYWAVHHTLFSRVAYISFEKQEEMRGIVELMSQIAGCCASDVIDDGHLMVWMEEQRAVAELMHSEGSRDLVSTIGFATYSAQHDSDFAEWLADLEDGLQQAEIEDSNRLMKLEGLLERLLKELQTRRR